MNKKQQEQHNLLSLLEEIHERMYPMVEYCERLQPIKINDDYGSISSIPYIDLINEDEMMKTKLFRLVDLDEMTSYDDQTGRSILKDLRKVIKFLQK